MPKRVFYEDEHGSRKRVNMHSERRKSLVQESNAAEPSIINDGLAFLKKRVRAHKESSGEEASTEVSSASNVASDDDAHGMASETVSTESSQGSSDVGLSGSDAGEHQSDGEAVDEVSTISFGALAKAQSSLKPHQHSKHNLIHRDPQDDHDDEALERKAGKKDFREFNRASKHAPTETSSKKAVSRKRSVVPAHKLDVRDPRFEPTTGRVNAEQVKKNYAFLSTYRDAEIAELKAGLRTTKDPNVKETMKRALTSMQSRRRAEKLEEQRQEVLRRHRKEEQEKVKEGKKPFYLKGSEIKERALKERFEGMKAKERTKAIERRRKKLTAKERKAMPLARRG